MHLALRPYLTTGVAIAGASVLVVAPLTVPDTHLPSLNVAAAQQAVTRDAQLLAVTLPGAGPFENALANILAGFTYAGSTFVGGLADGITGTADLFTGVTGGTAGILAGAFTGGLGLLNDGITTGADALAAVVDGLAAAIDQFNPAVTGNLLPSPENLLAALEAGLGGFTGASATLLDGLANGIEDTTALLNNLVKGVAGPTGVLTNLITNGTGLLSDGIVGTAKSLAYIVQGFADAAGQFLPAAGTVLSTVANGILSAGTLVGGALDTGAQFVTTTLASLVTTVTAATAAGATAVANVVHDIADVIGGLVPAPVAASAAATLAAGGSVNLTRSAAASPAALPSAAARSVTLHPAASETATEVTGVVKDSTNTGREFGADVSAAASQGKALGSEKSSAAKGSDAKATAPGAKADRAGKGTGAAKAGKGSTQRGASAKAGASADK